MIGDCDRCCSLELGIYLAEMKHDEAAADVIRLELEAHLKRHYRPVPVAEWREMTPMVYCLIEFVGVN